MGEVPYQVERYIYVYTINIAPITTDAADTTDFAAIFGHHWFTGPWPPEILLIPGFTRTSSLFELFPIMAATQLWGHIWIVQTVAFATADIINKGRSKSLIIMSFLRRLVQLSLQQQFNVHCTFLPGKCNLAFSSYPSLVSADSALEQHLHVATQLINQSLPHNTLKVYHAAWDVFSKFLASFSAETTIDTYHILAFISYCHNRLALSHNTARLYLAGVQHFLALRDPAKPLLFASHAV